MLADPEFRRMIANERVNELRRAASDPFPWPALRLGARTSGAYARVASELAGLRHKRLKPAQAPR